jgi:hypothetical protein
MRVMRIDPTNRLPPGVPPQKPRGGKTGGADNVFDAGVIAKILAGGIDQIFLKQFRDGGNAQGQQLACYQHLLRAPVTFQKPEVALKKGEWQLELDNPGPATHPIEGDLGVASDVTPYAFELASSLDLGIGEVIDV